MAGGSLGAGRDGLAACPHRRDQRLGPGAGLDTGELLAPGPGIPGYGTDPWDLERAGVVFFSPANRPACLPEHPRGANTDNAFRRPSGWDRRDHVCLAAPPEPEFPQARAAIIDRNGLRYF